MTNANQRALELHTKYKGKISTSLRDQPDSLEKLSAYYSPGVAAVSRLIADHPEKLREVTWVNNLVAVISDGSAVLGLGNVGPKAAMPVMEGKAMLFKHFADIDAVPIVLDVHTADDIVAAVTAIAPSFGAINLEDIAAPLCFEIEQRLKSTLDIPVFHDDQHGTATVVLAGLINALKVTGRSLDDCRIVLIGAGAAGVAIAKLLKLYGNPTIVAFDSKGALHSKRTDLNTTKQLLASYASENRYDHLEAAMGGADIFIGVSAPDILSEAHIRSMARDPIIFALANPDPEITPEKAHAAGAAIVATGRSDYPNQVNNAVAFPGIFRGALDNNVSTITDEHKILAAKAIAGLITNPQADSIIPSVMEPRLVPAIAEVIR